MPETIGYPNEDLTRGDKAEDLVRIAKARLDHGKTFRQTRREETWKTCERQYQGDHWSMTSGPQDATADLVVVNLSFSTLATLVPYVTGSDPRFLVEPYSKDATPLNARAQAAWLNRFWRTQDSGARPAVYGATHDHLVYGIGYGKCSYQIKERLDGKEIAELRVDSVSPWDVWLDPMADSPRTVRWLAQRIRTTLGELREDGTYEHLDELALGIQEAQDELDSDRLMSVPQDGPDSEYAWVEIYEFYDLVNRRLIVFSNSSPLPLKVVEEIDCPIRVLENHWLPKQPYRMSDLEQIWPLQQELNKSRSQMLTHRRRNIAKFLVREDVMDAEAEEALMSEVVGQMVKIKGTEPLDSVIKAVDLQPLTADAYNVSDLIMRDTFEITGVNEYLRGAAPQIRRTATEASIIEGASAVKATHKLSKVEDFVRDLGTLVLAVAADVFPLTDYDELELYITGRDAEALNRAELGDRLTRLYQQGTPEPILREEASATDLYGATALQMGPDIFEGVYQVEVVANSTELRNPIFKEQKYREMALALVQMTPALAQTGVQLNVKKVLELWFEASGIQDVEDMFSPMPQQAPMPLGSQPQPGGGPGGLQGMGEPNLDGMGPPDELISAMNSGALPPEA